MTLRKTMIAAAIALCAQSAFAAAMPAQAKASLMAELAHERAGKGLDNDHGYVINRQNPGQQDKVITRLNHTYKGIRIFESEAVVVSDNRGRIISQSLADRRAGVAKSGVANKKAAIGSQAAINAAIRSVGGAAAHDVAPSAETIIYPVMKTQRVAAAANPLQPDQRVDARLGVKNPQQDPGVDRDLGRLALFGAVDDRGDLAAGAQPARFVLAAGFAFLCLHCG